MTLAVHSIEDRFEQETIDVAAVREAVRAHLDETGKTQSELARITGLSGATISQFLKGTYAGNNEMVANAIMKAVEIEIRRKDSVKTPDFVMTRIAEDVLTVVQYAHNYKDIGVIYGDAGIGKTLALQRYAEENPGTIFITVNPTISNSQAILEELVEKLGKQEFGNRRKLRRTVVSTLKDSGRLLIIDEAQHLQMSALETLRSIYDECKIGLVLCGNETVYTQMRGRGKAADFAQLFSRVGIRRHLTGQVDKSDIERILGQEAEVPEECLDFFHRVANSPGGIRMAVKLFVLSWTLAASQGEGLNLETTQAAYELLMR